MSVTSIHGVQFFTHRSACISHFSSSHWSKRAVSFIQSCGTLLLYAMYKIGLLIGRNEDEVRTTKSFEKRKLVVCIHGLHDNPGQFNKIVSEIQKKNPIETDIFVPAVHQKGRCKLDEAAAPICREIQKWAAKPGAKELVLVGISNGARIARAIEAHLTKNHVSGNITTLRTVSIVGAWNGSSLAGKVPRFFLPQDIAEEMPTNSQRTTQLNREWKEGQQASAHIKRHYTFIASPHDWQVPNFSSTLPDIENQPAQFALVPGHGHLSIVNAVAGCVAEVVHKNIDPA